MWLQNMKIPVTFVGPVLFQQYFDRIFLEALQSLWGWGTSTLNFRCAVVGQVGELLSVCWFGTLLGIRIPTDFHIFQRG